MKKWLQEFMVNEPPYKVIKLNSKQLEQMSNVDSLTISHFCNKCGQLRTFKCPYTGFNEIDKAYRAHALATNWASTFEDYSEKCRFTFFLKFICTHDCDEIHYCIILIDNGTIQKIGQFPTFSKEEVNTKLYRYKLLIPKYYPELTKAVSAYSQNMGVASFVYLRRILEHLVETRYKNYGGIENIRFIDKLHEVEKREKIIPDEFQDIENQLYTVLSKGVHEYEEDECNEMFPAVKFIIESILDEELMKKEHEQKAREAKEIIQNKLKIGD